MQPQLRIHWFCKKSVLVFEKMLCTVGALFTERKLFYRPTWRF